MRSLRIAGFIAAALLCLAIGVFILYVAAAGDLAPGVAPFLGYVAASVFIVAGFRLLQLNWRPRSEGNGAAALICIAFATIGGWIAVGPGERICTAGSAGGAASAEGLSCRVPFGIGALLAAGMAFYAATLWLRARRAGNVGNARRLG